MVGAIAHGLPTAALVVETTTGTASAPLDDPGWSNLTISGRKYTYLGDGWAISARHVGPSPSQIANPSFSEQLHFETGSFGYIPGQAFYVPNPCYGTAGCITPNSAYTDLQLVRINGDPGLPSLTIASQPIMASTPIAQREVLFISRGRDRNANLSYWTATQVPGSDPPNDTWVAGTADNHTHSGYTTISAGTKRWGTNQIADETALEGKNPGLGDDDLRLLATYSLSAGPTDVVSMATRFDAPAAGVPANEAQAVSGDSGAAVFHKRNGTTWELIGIVNGISAPIVPGSNPPVPYDRLANNSSAIYGMFTLFADLTYYRDAIMNLMATNANYSILGDINLDGKVTGYGTGTWSNDDFVAFAAGWGYNNGTGVGDITSWKNGDLNRDGKTDDADYELLANSVVLPGDFNGDRVVDSADYTLWRNSFGQNIGLPNETASLGSVTIEDYNVWKANFGLRIPTLEELVGAGAAGLASTDSAASAGGAVPEPSACVLAAMALLAIAGSRRRLVAAP